jgi:small basic protein (TIGR04137 family)
MPILSCLKSHLPEVLTLSIDCDFLMTMDQSLRVQAGAIKTRNVLTRAERVARLQELDRFDEESSIVGMPKVRVMKVSLKRKKKVKKAEDEK